MMNSKQMDVREITFHSETFKVRTRVVGLRIAGPEGRKHTLPSRVRIWINGTAVEASADTWNRGLDPLIVCPERSYITVVAYDSFCAVSVELITEEQ